MTSRRFIQVPFNLELELSCGLQKLGQGNPLGKLQSVSIWEDWRILVIFLDSKYYQPMLNACGPKVKVTY
jgi:hypothetical protein